MQTPIENGYIRQSGLEDKEYYQRQRGTIHNKKKSHQGHTINPKCVCMCKYSFRIHEAKTGRIDWRNRITHN